MKKIFLFLVATALTLSLNSCSSDTSGTGSVSFRVNGTKKTFNTSAVESGGQVFVYGYIGNVENPTEFIDITITSGETGAGAITDFSYDNSNGSYSPAAFTTNVSKNTGNQVKGTFSGTLAPLSGSSNITITEGTFSASPHQQ